jgi:hypothetical protein
MFAFLRNGRSISPEYAYDKIGVQGLQGTRDLTRPGDLIYLKSREHVYVVNDWVDANNNGKAEFGELYVCAHTANRRNVTLPSISVSESDCLFWWIGTYREN